MKSLLRGAMILFIVSVILSLVTSTALAHVRAFQEATEEATVEPTPTEGPTDPIPPDGDSVYPFVNFLELILSAVNAVVLGSSVASGIIVLTLVDIAKRLPLPMFNDPNDPSYIDGPALQKWIGLGVVVIFWIAQALGVSEQLRAGYNLLEALIPNIIAALTLLAGTFGWSWAAHNALKQTAVPFFGKSSQRT